MKRNINTDQLSQVEMNEFQSRMAFHEAGHAVAIYSHNRGQNLPQVVFNIKIKEHNFSESDALASEQDEDYIATVEGGRLIPSLPNSENAAKNRLLSLQQLKEDETDVNSDLFLAAVQADIFNLLVGPIAEAKYVSILDDECFNVHLLTLQSLVYYGGGKDIELINQYLQCFWNTDREVAGKLTALLHEAFAFVTEFSNWLVIKTLAHSFLEQKKQFFEYQEIVSVIEAVDCINDCKRNSLSELWPLNPNS